MTSDVIGIAQYYFLKSKLAAKYFALYQNLKLFLVNLHLKNWKQNKNSFSDTTSIKYKEFE